MSKETGARDREVIADYRSGLSLKVCGDRHGLHSTTVHRIIQRYAPEILRPPGGGYRKGQTHPASGNRYWRNKAAMAKRRIGGGE